MNTRSKDGVRVITLLKPERVAICDVMILLEDLAKYDQSDNAKLAAQHLSNVAIRVDGEGVFNPAWKESKTNAP